MTKKSVLQGRNFGAVVNAHIAQAYVPITNAEAKKVYLRLTRRQAMMATPEGRAFLVDNGYARKPRGRKRGRS